MPPREAPREGKKIDALVVDIAVAAIAFLLIMGILGSFFSHIVGDYIGIIGWFYTRNLRLWYIIIAILVGLLDIILLGAAIFIIKRYNNLRKEIPSEEIVSHYVSPEREFQQNWQDITALMASGHPSDWNMAILRADSQLDDTLQHMGYDGETMADRLKIVDPTKLMSMDRVWSAHRLRNTIAHDPLQEYTREMMQHAFDSYKIAFKELGMLQEIPEKIKESDMNSKAH